MYFPVYIKVFKHRYSLDCHQRQTHPHQRVTGRTSNAIIVNTPKPVSEDKESFTDSMLQSNVDANMKEQDLDVELKAIPEPCPMSFPSTTTALKRQRKKKPISKGPGNTFDTN